MNKKKIYYLLFIVALSFFLVALIVASFNLYPKASSVLIMIGTFIILVNLTFFKFW